MCLECGQRVGRELGRLGSIQDPQKGAEAKAGLLHNEAEAHRQGVGWAAIDSLHDITNRARPSQEPEEVSLAGALRLNQAGQVIGGNEAKTNPLYLSRDEQASSKDTAS